VNDMRKFNLIVGNLAGMIGMVFGAIVNDVDFITLGMVMCFWTEFKFGGDA